MKSNLPLSLSLKELLIETKDGEWGQEHAGDGLVGMFVIRGTDFEQARFGDLTGVPVRFIPQRAADRKTLQPRDILIEAAGGTKKQPTGRTVYLHSRLFETADKPITCASFSRFLRVNNELAEPGYVFWYLQYLYRTGVMESFQIQHTGISRFQYTKFSESVSIPLLSRGTQENISRILFALDDKIELNRKMNTTLEQIAQALFKSWFVDFDPVKAKAAGRQSEGIDAQTAALFPSEFEESELGLIPRGWKIKTVSETATRIAMGPFGSRIKTDNFVAEGVPIIRGNNLTDGFNEANFVYITEAKADELKSSNAYPGDIVFTHRGTLGQVGLIPDTSNHPRYVVSQSQMLLSVDKTQVSSKVLYRFFQSVQGQHALLANTNQVGVPAIARPTTSLKAIRFVCPPKSFADIFDRITSPLDSKRFANIRESGLLTTIRDSLLPKLISGQLRVPDAERVAEAVL